MYIFWEYFVDGVVYVIGVVVVIVVILVLIVWVSLKLLVNWIWLLIVYGVGMIVMFFFLVVYNLIIYSKVWVVLCCFDYVVIYLMIVGIYMLIGIIGFGGWFGWGLVIFFWMLVIIGIVMKLVFFYCWFCVGFFFYFGMGWFGIVVVWLLI